MNKKKPATNRLRNERGIMTVDFIFGMVLVLGFTVLLFSLSMTLTMVEVTQYITFSAARNYGFANISQAEQESAGAQKFGQLISHPTFAPMYRNGWFVLQEQPDIGHIGSQFPEYEANLSDKNMFHGVGTQFTAKMLDFKIPFYGSTSNIDGGGESGFKSYIASYTWREVTDQECNDFEIARWPAIAALRSQTGGSGYATHSSLAKAFPIPDNGCGK